MERLWNFVLIGNTRSGVGAIASTLNSRPSVVCHVGLFSADDATRKEAHEAYFGECESPKSAPSWFIRGNSESVEHTSLWQYLTKVFDTPKREETSIGVQVDYEAVSSLEMYDTFYQKYQIGGFGIIHVVRNPVACFVSLKQAQHSNIWQRTYGKTESQKIPLPIRIEPSELTEFCRNSLAIRGKINACCNDKLIVQYSDLLCEFHKTMLAVFDHVELPLTAKLAKSKLLRLRNKTMQERVTNWSELIKATPSDVRSLLEAEDLV